MSDSLLAEQSAYTDRHHPDALIDFPPLAERQATWRKYHAADPMLECPKCKGHGGWNIRTNAYQLPAGMADNAENRHKYVHFRASCSQCVGWGYVTEQRDVDCIHEADKGTPTRFNCVTNYRCTKCGKEWSIDSSD